jgi:hypothetical protein
MAFSTTDMITAIRAEMCVTRAHLDAMEKQLETLEKTVTPVPAPAPALLLPSQLVVPVAPVAPVAETAKKSVGRPKKVTRTFPPLPTGGEVPGPGAYRLAAADIKMDVCVGRILTEDTKDTRWSVAIYPEAQCGAAVADGSDLCAGCLAKEARYLAEGKKYDRWTGRITEEPLAWVHMLGTAWAAAHAASGRLRWVGAAVGGAGTDTASDGGSVSSAGSAAEKRAMREAFKAAKAEAKAIEKAAKEKVKAIEKEAKEAAKAAKKADGLH